MLNVETSQLSVKFYIQDLYITRMKYKTLKVNFEYFFMVLAVFCWAICSRVPTSILTRDAYFLWTNLGNLVQ